MHIQKLMDQNKNNAVDSLLWDKTVVFSSSIGEPNRVILNVSGQSAASCSGAPTFFLLQ